MISKGYKLSGPTTLVNKNGSNDPKFWSFKRPTFSFVNRTSTINEDYGLFRCRQTGELIERKFKAV